MVCSLTALPAQAAVSSNTKGDNEWNLVFSDEFNDDTVNAQYWNRYPAAIDCEDYFSMEVLLKPLFARKMFR